MNRDEGGVQEKEKRQEQADAARRVSEGERPWEEELGVRSVVDAVRDLPFPKTLAQIVEEAGDREVAPSKDARIPLSRVTEKLKEHEFATLADFQTAVQRHWQGVRNLQVPPEQRQQGPGANYEEHRR